MPEGDVTREAARALIADVFEHHPVPYLKVIETEKGIAVQFIALSKRLGGLQCTYLVESIAAALLKAYPKDYLAAYESLTIVLAQLPRGVHIGMENVADLADRMVLESHEIVHSLMNGEEQTARVEAQRRRDKAALAKMAERNHKLIAPPSPGAKAVLTPQLISGAIGVLRAKSKAKAEVTQASVADLLNVSTRAVYNALQKAGVTFDRLLETYEWEQ